MIDDILVHLGILGHSATALVDKVRCKRIVLARKRIQCNYKVKREEMIEEVAHLQRLSHAHVVRGVGTYVLKKELSILLYPAAAYNLETFMEEYTNQEEELGSQSGGNRMLYHKRRALFQFFDCLSSTIAFVHGNLIKHMDIKPTNILIEQRTTTIRSQDLRPDDIRYKLYLADFGIARSYNTAAEVETDSYTAFTKMYAAPEVVRQDARGFPADIFSLGRVFLEMLTFLAIGRQRLIDFRESVRDRNLSYDPNTQVIWELKRLTDLDQASSSLIPVIHSMLSFDAGSRPNAQEVQASFGGGEAACCTAGPEPFWISRESEFGDVTFLTGVLNSLMESSAE